MTEKLTKEETCLGHAFVKPADKILIGYRGKVSDETDPGNHLLTDPRATEKLRNIFLGLKSGQEPETYCANSVHTGEVFSINRENKSALFTNGGARLYQTHLFESDGAVIAMPPNGNTPVVLASRGRDCLNSVGYDDKNLFAVHASIQNICGFGKGELTADFRPVFRSLFDHIDSSRCEFFMGPSIGGIKDDCCCYEYTEKIDKQDGTAVINAIKQTHPGIEWRHFEPCFILREDKMIIKFGELMKCLLVNYYGVPEENVLTDNNLCTRCHSERWYSRRHEMEVEDVHAGSNLSWIAYIPD